MITWGSFFCHRTENHWRLIRCTKTSARTMRRRRLPWKHIRTYPARQWSPSILVGKTFCRLAVFFFNIMWQGRRSGYESEGDRLVCNPTFSSWGSGGAVSPPAGCGAEPRRQTHFGKNLLRINLKSGLFSVAVYTPNSDPISDVHWLVRRKIGSAVRGCAKLVDIRTSKMIDSWRHLFTAPSTPNYWYYAPSVAPPIALVLY